MNNLKQKTKQQTTTYVNDNIRCKNVRIIDDGNGNQLGIMQKLDAIEIAKSKGLDLMQVGFNEGISICKICDYGKFMYEQKQKAKEAKKKAKAAAQETKEISFTIRIDQNDLNVKVRHIKKFLSDNCKVKLVVKFNKREMKHIDFGKTVMNSVLDNIKDIADIEFNPKLEGRFMYCIVRPKK